MTRKILFATALLLAGCANSDPAKIVFAAKTALDGAALVATHYAEDLPRCSPTQAPPCSDQAIIDKANAAAQAALPVMNQAESYVRQMQAAATNPLAKAPPAETVQAAALLARAAVDEFTAIVATMKGK